MEGDFPRLHLNDIEDMLLLVIQNRLNNLKGNVIVNLAVALPFVSAAWSDTNIILGFKSLHVYTAIRKLNTTFKGNAILIELCCLLALSTTSLLDVSTASVFHLVLMGLIVTTARVLCTANAVEDNS
ncbi:hypothetical protein Tco_0860755 [Tanacetum coccineum]|uniref:Uncharacterized protein n=1 Tax=Tanacetum coccineum TaxID=301880 RepID=A0ABQ5BJL1_9ASTR